ncbi:MAG: formate/nitrite transporter family protein [Bacilli bacterium]|nr:formate/nitrite transporter family protein [Bacilli bacterium]
MLGPRELAHECGNIGEKKVHNSIRSMIIGGILSGLFVGLGYYGYLVTYSSFAALINAPLGRFFGALVFTVGIILVVLTGSELFTGNCLVILGYCNKQYGLGNFFKYLGIVWISNFIGSLLLVCIIYFSKMPNDIVIGTIKDISVQKTSLDFIVALMRGILCNILVALGVYASYAAKDVSGKILASAIPVFLFVLCGYEHSVANMFILPLSMFYDSGITVIDIFKNIIPVTIGNFIGGGIIIPVAYFFLYVYKSAKIHT